MLDFEEELKKFKPSKELENAEDAIMNRNMQDMTDIMLDYGAVNAINMDGGSSTVMYYNGEYLTWPSSASGTSRYLPNAFLIRK